MEGNIGLQNVVNVNAKDIHTKVVMYRKAKQVLGLLGPPGCGKSASTKFGAMQVAKSLGKRFVEQPTPQDWKDPNNFCFMVLMISQIEDIDSKGLPYVVDIDGRKTTVFSLTELFPQEGCGIIFLDEFPNGRPQTRVAMQQMLLDHVAGNFKISDDIQFIIAGNRPNDNCGAFSIEHSLRNRVHWYEVTRPTIEELIKLMSDIGQPIHDKLAGWVISIGRKHIDGFNPKAEHLAFGTPRSLEMASKMLIALDELNLNSNKNYQEYVGAAMGAEAGRDFVSFLKLSEAVDMNHLLENPASIKKYKTGDPGLLYSICVSLLDYVGDDKALPKIFLVLKELNMKEYGVFVIDGIIRKRGKVQTITALRSHQHMVDLAKEYLATIQSE